MPTKLVTPYFRVSYPNVFKPKAFADQEPKYSVLALFPKGCDLKALQEAAKEACVEKWGADQKKWPKKLRSPFRKHEEKADDEGKLPQGMEAGGIFITMSSKERPGLVDQQKNDILQASDFYAGCWARAHVNAYAYETMGNAGVSFGLNHLQKVKEGDPLGNRTRVEDAFTPIEGANGEAAESADELFG